MKIYIHAYHTIIYIHYIYYIYIPIYIYIYIYNGQYIMDNVTGQNDQ